MKGILFDFNGTLYFDSDKHLQAMRRCFSTWGKVPTDEYIIQNVFGRTNRQIYMENGKADATDEDIERWAEEKERLYREACMQSALSSLAPGAEELLDYLKEHHIPYAVATGSGLDNVEFYFSYLKLGRWFSMDNLIYCDGSIPGKPAPDIYHKAANAIGLSAKDCLIFEDGTSGLRSAFASGAGAVCAIYEKGLPDPVTADMSPICICHDFLGWRDILRQAGLLED